ncbi:MAG: hypothetical protein J6U23_03890 [Clostridiales bacterium]|nr:hypothetical protein [Clostridiales bacterium]
MGEVNITALDENEVSRYQKISNGQGMHAKSSMQDYMDRLKLVREHGFKADDSCTVHGVIDELIVQMNDIYGVMEEADQMIDNLMHIIQTDIIDKEDELARSIRES